MIVLVLFIFYSSQWSPLRSSIRKLNPGASPSSSRGCCDRQSISFPTCVGGSEVSFVETRCRLVSPRVKVLCIFATCPIEISSTEKYFEDHLADSLQLWHPEQQLAELARHVRVVRNGVVLRSNSIFIS